MADRFMQTVLTPSVLAAQDHYFGRHAAVGSAPDRDPLTEEERGFIEARDSFYMATIAENGWPYVQHRGGAPGFLRVVSPTQLGFADYKGNRQMLSTGNLAANDRVALFLMDYPRRERLKILGHARVEDARQHPELVVQLADPAARGFVERLFLIDVLSFDWNCPKYITPRYTAAEVEAAVAPLKQRIAELEARYPSDANARRKNGLIGQLGGPGEIIGSGNSLCQASPPAQMIQVNPVHTPKSGGQAVNVLGTRMLLRVFGRDTNGTLAVVESHDSPEAGPPPHIHHREDETFQILEGEYEFMVAGKTISAKPGDTLFAPRDIPHTYRCVSAGGGKLSVVLTPAGFENFFAEIGTMSPQEQQDIPRVIEVAQRYGLEFLPPPGPVQ